MTQHRHRFWKLDFNLKKILEAKFQLSDVSRNKILKKLLKTRFNL